MKDTIPRLSLKQEIIDTALICTVFFVSALIGKAWPFRVIMAASFVMAIIEIFVSSHYAAKRGTHHSIIARTTMVIVLAMALALIVTKPLSGKQYLLWIGVVTASDASGLLFGRVFGTHRAFFSKHISPNKTYEGYFGEFIGSLSAAWLIMVVLNLSFTGANYLYSLTGFIACAAGDLLGSAAKRELGIKDSEERLQKLPVLGKIEKLMRSRHGFLDCFDSASVALIYFIILLCGRP